MYIVVLRAVGVCVPASVLPPSSLPAAPERGCLPPQTMSAVMEAMGYNPASERVQLQGVLAMGSIGRTGQWT